MKQDFKRVFADRLGFLMRERGVTEEGLARKVNRPVHIVAAWCNGSDLPRLKDTKLLSQVLGVSLDWLCGNDDYVGWKPSGKAEK
ncbi:helix-turn-helix domain-containing protein [Sansalvadorimonas verongulae]|uniref:helix-turn-helix domain-containing protein n=1 Tax=Sansalvadorimonas verongulae TaxID=2172824 RepID=UPI0018AD2925|nr:helix-turn-helix domain-containing protein [Sansalvadorimonas verongulae]